MVVHTDVSGLLGAWALEACDEAEYALVESHLAMCDDCAVEARRLRGAVAWLGVDRVVAPPAELRGSVLAAARARRAPVLRVTLTSAYADQVAMFDAVLTDLSPADWQRADPRHRHVVGVLRHLAGNDAALAADLGLPVVHIPEVDPGPGVRRGWRDQTEVLLDGLAVAELEQEVRLAGAVGLRRPLRDALVQRAFETWTHRDDVGATRTAAPPEQVHRIIDLAVTLLPDAVRAHHPAQTGRAWRLVLDGPGGGDWTSSPDTAVEVTIHADAVEFARLVASRGLPRALPRTVTGDPALAAAILSAATTLGCD